jgi:hypothetical protein
LSLATIAHQLSTVRGADRILALAAIYQTKMAGLAGHFCWEISKINLPVS